ncbi:MAG: tRNA (guanosine(37)-N1)-methyltransferase TrmD [Desulfuromonas thiophila]|jgi:tRNA (guanine37-N1)-methyltransferase|nr:tRNA (guanosine(37)-N1)-methyltransferase TrmD [Desulfuromonas thiophila]MDY0397423.1 tRNA (guanosine(37)-N1)-methyltransferase TrmD [Desulfuromonas thiophila]
MQFDVLTLFPHMFDSPFADSIVGRACQQGRIELHTHPLRDWAEGRHQVTDDQPYGGGGGMILKPEPVWRALQDLRRLRPAAPVLLLTPQGQRFDQRQAEKLAQYAGLIFVCGRYEGFDERIRGYVDAEYSLGDFVLTGGELAAMVMIDAIARLVPGVLGNSCSAAGDSFSDGLLEFPQYTRPVEYAGQRVPEVLLSGDHARIADWRRWQQLCRTRQRRPDLWQSHALSEQDRRLLQRFADSDPQADA